jgi:hypothetical protein
MTEQLSSPVLFIIFNRPEFTEKVFHSIRRAKPKKLYVAADGPRDHILGEFDQCQAARSIINSIDWDCQVFKLYQSQNFGCKLAVSSAITWFFDNETEGIILEDDCIPDNYFFKYCEILLKNYRHHEKIMSISGSSFFTPLFNKNSYSFTYYSDMWGWATWRRAWNLYDARMDKWEKNKHKLNKYFKNTEIAEYWCRQFDQVSDEKIDTWDYQWIWTVIDNDGLCITPHYNMIDNIGFGPNATHTFESDWYLKFRKINEIKFPLSHPKKKSRNLYIEDMLRISRFRIIKKNENKFIEIIKKIYIDISTYGGNFLLYRKIRSIFGIN